MAKLSEEYNPCPKVVKIQKKPSNGIPKEIIKAVDERDKKTCQYCGYKGPGTEYHHIILAGGRGKKKIHHKANIITLCGQFAGNQCHRKMHEGDRVGGEWTSQKVFQEWAVNWSRRKYGPEIDRIKEVVKKGIRYE